MKKRQPKRKKKKNRLARKKKVIDLQREKVKIRKTIRLIQRTLCTISSSTPMASQSWRIGSLQLCSVEFFSGTSLEQALPRKSPTWSSSISTYPETRLR